MGHTLDGYALLLSAGIPSQLSGSRRAQDLFDLLVVMVGGVVLRGGVIVFGGHPSVTPLVHRIASQMQMRPGLIRLFQLRRFSSVCPPQVHDKSVFGDIAWFGQETDDPRSLAAELGEMRNAMARAAQAALFVGGNTVGFLGDRPGVVDEFARFRAQHKDGPTWFLGLLDGAVRRDLIATGVDERNSLEESERILLHETHDVDLAAGLVLMDLGRQGKAGATP